MNEQDRLAKYMCESQMMVFNAIFGGDKVEQEKQQEDRREEESARFDSLLEDAIEEINDCDVEYVIKEFASCLASQWTLYRDRRDIGAKMVEELKSCIKAEAKLRVKHRLSGE